MTRNTPEFDQRIADWLETDPATAPPEVLSTVVAALPAIPQARRGLLAPRRFALMNSMRLASAAIVAVVAVGGALYLLRPGGGPGVAPSTEPPATVAPSPSPAISPSPAPTTAPSPTGDPVSFTSPLYGYSVDVPARFAYTPGPATVPWPDGGVADTTHGEWFDVFPFDPTGMDIGFVGVAAQPIPDGTTADAWMRGFAERQAASSYACTGPVEDWVDASVGTLAVRRIDIICNGEISGEDFTGWDYAYVVFAIDGTGYVINGGPEGVDPLLATFQPPVSFTSPIYGYTVSAPGGWEVTPATVNWPPGADPISDAFEAPAEQRPDFDYLYVAAQQLPEGMTAAAWLLAYAELVAESARDCKGPVDNWTDAAVGSLPIRRLDLECSGLRFTDVAFVIDGTGYTMAGNRPGIARFLDSFQPGG